MCCAAQALTNPKGKAIKTLDISLDHESREVLVRDLAIDLTPSEFDLVGRIDDFTR